MRDFNLLIDNIWLVHKNLQYQTVNAVNQALTIRNWLIGFYIVEYDQIGVYLSENQKVGTLSTQLKDNQKSGSLSLILPIEQILGSLTTISGEKSKLGSLTTQSKSLQKRVNGELILTKLSYSHLEKLIRIDDDLKRTFYEIECIKGIWSVRQLKRQISSLYYERSGLSAKPEKLSELVQQNISPQNTTDIIKNIYAFEFMDLNFKDVIEESDLETALLDHLQEFIIELGNGFCFEARQKRILIGENYFYIDLLFYHRILKCHVLVELKIGKFEHGDIGQLNTYLNYFKAEISEDNDNPPVGILMVAEKDNTLVKYATAGMDENLFVQQYLVQLPSKDQLEKYIDNELKNLV